MNKDSNLWEYISDIGEKWNVVYASTSLEEKQLNIMSDLFTVRKALEIGDNVLAHTFLNKAVERIVAYIYHEHPHRLDHLEMALEDRDQVEPEDYDKILRDLLILFPVDNFDSYAIYMVGLLTNKIYNKDIYENY